MLTVRHSPCIFTSTFQNIWLYSKKHKIIEMVSRKLRVLFCWCCYLVAELYLTLVTPWTVARQAPLFMGFPRQEYWRGLPFPSPGYLPDPGMELAFPSLAGGFFTSEPLPGKPQGVLYLTPKQSFSSWKMQSKFNYKQACWVLSEVNT